MVNYPDGSHTYFVHTLHLHVPIYALHRKCWGRWHTRMCEATKINVTRTLPHTCHVPHTFLPLRGTKGQEDVAKVKGVDGHVLPRRGTCKVWTKYVCEPSG